MSAFTLPSASLLSQSVLSGVFVGALYGLMGLGLSLSWGLLRLINLAHFAFAFLAAYLCYELASRGLDPLLALAAIVPLFFAIGAGLQGLVARFAITPFNSLLLTFGLTGIVGTLACSRPPTRTGWRSRSTFAPASRASARTAPPRSASSSTR